MPRVTDDNKYMDNAMGGPKQPKGGARPAAVATDEERDQTGMRSRGEGACDRFGLSSGDLPSSSGSAGETVVVHGVDVFLDLEAVRLCGVREDTDQPSWLPLAGRRDRFPRVARKRGWPYLYAPRMIPATLCVLDAFLAVRAVAVHDGEDHVPLEVLDESECEGKFRGVQLSGSLHIWTTEYLHCARESGQHIAGRGGLREEERTQSGDTL